MRGRVQGLTLGPEVKRRLLTLLRDRILPVALTSLRLWQQGAHTLHMAHCWGKAGRKHAAYVSFYSMAPLHAQSPHTSRPIHQDMQALIAMLNVGRPRACGGGDRRRKHHG